MTKALLFAVACSAAYGGSITYDYTGNTFITCSFGPCPASAFSDELIASVTFSAPLPAGQGLTNFLSSPSLIGWTFGDLAGNQLYSSTDPNATSELEFDGVPGLFLATNSRGAISESYINATGNGILALDDPAVTSGGIVYAGVINAAGAWAAYGSIPGQWTQTLNGFQGGTTSAPVVLLGGSPVAGLTGTIGGRGSEDYYQFYWAGGAFSATASITGAASTASYLFTDGLAGSSCSGSASQTLNSGDSFTGTLASANLAPGQYCIGIDANSANDPNFSLTFNTPVSGVPEPSGLVLLSAGLGMIAVLRRAKLGRRHS
jgi:hypothetical protein